jgi:hypothetical protein
MSKFSKELIESLTEACEHAEGKPSGVRVHVVEVPDVRAIRRQLWMSQQEFARVYRIPLATLEELGTGPAPTGRTRGRPSAGYREASTRGAGRSGGVAPVMVRIGRPFMAARST